MIGFLNCGIYDCSLGPVTCRSKVTMLLWISLQPNGFCIRARFFQNPFSSESYVVVLKEAEQFIWAGSEMDPVSSLPQCFFFFIIILILMYLAINF
jgi:hypothetical protein